MLSDQIEVGNKPMFKKPRGEKKADKRQFPTKFEATSLIVTEAII